MSYTIVCLDNEAISSGTPDLLRSTVTDDYIILKKSAEESIPAKLFEAIEKPETGAAYCEPEDGFFPIIQPSLQTKFTPNVIAIKTSLFTNENVVLDDLFETIIKIYNKAIVRRV